MLGVKNVDITAVPHGPVLHGAFEHQEKRVSGPQFSQGKNLEAELMNVRVGDAESRAQSRSATPGLAGGYRGKR